jgi:hypothetical protein
VIDLNFQGLALKKLGTKMRLNLNYRGELAKQLTKDGGSYFGEAQGLNHKRKDWFVNSFHLAWTAG